MTDAEERASNAEARASAAESDYELAAQQLAETKKTVAKLEAELERSKESFAQEMTELFRRQPSGSPNGCASQEAPPDDLADGKRTKGAGKGKGKGRGKGKGKGKGNKPEAPQ